MNILNAYIIFNNDHDNKDFQYFSCLSLALPKIYGCSCFGLI